MPDVRRPGMDHGLYPYVPLPARRPLVWPQRCPVALWICLHLEYWELEPPPGARHPPGIEGTWQIFHPDYRTFAHREYGNRIGVFRVLDALDEHPFPVTVAVNAEVCRRYPQLVEECLDRGYEIAAGGTYATRMITSAMTAEEEIAHIDEAMGAVREVTGADPAGWIGQDCGESTRTPLLVAQRGFRYIADWPNDEQPYWMSTTPRLVSVPQQTEWDDVNLLWVRQITTPRFPRLVEDALERLIADGSHSARTFVLNVHPWLFGQPHRIRYLRESLRALGSRPGVWRATAREIAAQFVAQTDEARR